MNKSGIRLLPISVGLVMTTSLGCVTTTSGTTNSATRKVSEEPVSFLDRMPWSKKKSDQPEPYPNPVKLAATWTPDTLVQTGRTPTRGFGGRVYFYDEKSRPVPVEGTLVIHGFDEAAADSPDRVKRFEFTPEQFTRHFSQSDLGASYSLWIPWDAIGGPQRRVLLVATFKTFEGRTVQGTPATILLPGHSTPSAAPDDETSLGEFSKLSPQYKRHRDANQSLVSRTSGLTTTTIKRRRPGQAAQIDLPSGSLQKAEMLAAGGATPSHEVSLRRTPARDVLIENPRSPTIQTVSAQEAVDWPPRLGLQRLGQ